MLGSIVFFAVSASSLMAGCEDRISVSVLSASSGYELHLVANSAWEITRSILCEVKAGDDVVFPMHMIGSTTLEIDKLHFKLKECNEGKFVFFVETANPKVVLGIYDFTLKRFWPDPNNVSNAESLFQDLVDCIGEPDYLLSSQEKGNIPLNVR